jgi:hypothetical protein
MLLDYITNYISETVKELHISSDSCPVQNRGYTVDRFISTLAAHGKFNKIFHYFPGREFYQRVIGLIKSSAQNKWGLNTTRVSQIA